MDQYGRGKVNFWRWTDGRQGSGYKIFYMWQKLFDCLIIRYPVGSFIKPHIDPVAKHLNHHRINITIRKCKKGGEFHCDSAFVNLKLPRVVWFRPDIGAHSVAEIKEGERWVLSFGWVISK